MITVEERYPDVKIMKQADEPLFGFYKNIHDIPRDRGGIILFSDEEGNVLFVGKARKLRQRVKRHLEDNVSPLKDARDDIAKIEVWFIEDPMHREMLETYYINTKFAKYNRDKVFFDH
ncbi:GIY-YIG nuclease family protein [Savagea sp. SN6]|uniref:GIY-YIG nuclease family protein n=1 Tax=Savagea serpentis TaxID=2785297 RepID=A0A8J7G441_9BACL|nr:GIY-YIG nuclease family protein [Savagea serpentis]MBF4500862.1 GIY-YIG nuclease family protein [Savagea serpentis]